MKTKEEIEILKCDALAGDAVAQNDLGCAYSSGDGVPKDLKKAFYWFELSAKQGERVAQYNLGRHYHYGLGIEKKDIHKAIEWYEKSANQRYANAAVALGEIYEKGYRPLIFESPSEHVPNNSITANPVEAFYWYKRGGYDDKARYHLAKCYEMGIGTAVNLRLACMFYRNCRTEDAQERLASILKDYLPMADQRIGTVDILRKNPFRILGVWSNSTAKEIRACQSKIDVMMKVGKDPIFEIDKVLPCTASDFIEICQTKISFAEQKYNNSSNGLEKTMREHALKRLKQDLLEWQRNEKRLSSLDFRPKRDVNNVEDALRKIATDQDRLRYAMFWFCKQTPEDEEAFKLLSEHKWEEAATIWEKGKNYSAIINRTIMYWLDRQDYLALKNMLGFIHDENKRNDFIKSICSDRFQISETEFSQLFWDTLSSFPEEEFPFMDFSLDSSNMMYSLGISHGRMEHITKDDANCVQQIVFEKLKFPLEQSIIEAEKLDRSDLERCRDAYDKIVQKAPYQLHCIKRTLGENDYRFKLLSDDVASKLLEFSIYYNNNNTTNWNASYASLYMAKMAKKIAFDETIRQRCSDNIDVLSKNSQNAQIEKSIEKIDVELSKIEKDDVSLSDIKNLPKRLVLYLEILGNNAGVGSPLHKKACDGVVNRVMNLVIRICNNKKDFITYSEAKSLLDKFKSLSLSDDVKMRLEKNIRILSDNGVAALQKGNFGALDGSDDFSSSSHPYKRHTYTKEEPKKRRLHKLLATIIAAIAIGSICYYLNWNSNWGYLSDNYPWWLCICVCLLVFIVLFVISMWCLELKSDPYDYDIPWVDRAYNSLMGVANDILKAGSNGSNRTYSGPFAMPVQCLALLVIVIGYPIKGIAKLAALIK